MGHTTIWIDHHHCFIFSFTSKGVEELKIKNEMSSDQEHLKKFYHEVADKLGTPAQLLIVGPGTGKEEFKNHLEQHHHTELTKAIVGTETMKDHPSKAEILDVSRKFFDHHFKWHGSDL